MRMKSVLGLAGLFLASVTLTGCENCGCFGRRGATAGYDHSTAIGMNGTTPTTPTTMAQGTVPTTPSMAASGMPTTMGNPTAKSGNTSSYSSGTQSSNFGMPTNNVPAFTNPSANGTSSIYSNSASGMSSTGITPATDRSVSPGSLDGANRYTVPPPPPSVPRTGLTPGATSGLTPSMPPPPPVSSYTPGSTVPTLKNTDE